MTLKKLIKRADDADELCELLADELGVTDDDEKELLMEIAERLKPDGDNDEDDDEKEGY